MAFFEKVRFRVKIKIEPSFSGHRNAPCESGKPNEKIDTLNVNCKLLLRKYQL